MNVVEKLAVLLQVVSLIVMAHLSVTTKHDGELRERPQVLRAAFSIMGMIFGTLVLAVGALVG